jgi:RNA polymerase sigma factor (sigma-70 family)
MAMRMPTPSRRPDGEACKAVLDWTDVFARHDHWLRTVVRARLGEPQAVDEVMQEVYLAAVKQQAPLLDADKVAPWLYRLAVRQSLIYRRKQGRRRKLVDRYAQRFQPSQSDRQEIDPLEWLLAEERREQVRDAVARLSGADAEILMLKYNENWSYQKLAEQLGISCSAVEARLHRARRRLREALTQVENSKAMV